MADIAELGKLVKAKHPGAYDDMADDAVGRAVKAKHPGSYDDFADIPKPKGFIERFTEVLHQVPDTVKAVLEKGPNQVGEDILRGIYNRYKADDTLYTGSQPHAIDAVPRAINAVIGGATEPIVSDLKEGNLGGAAGGVAGNIALMAAPKVIKSTAKVIPEVANAAKTYVPAAAAGAADELSANAGRLAAASGAGYAMGGHAGASVLGGVPATAVAVKGAINGVRSVGEKRAALAAEESALADIGKIDIDELIKKATEQGDTASAAKPTPTNRTGGVSMPEPSEAARARAVADFEELQKAAQLARESKLSAKAPEPSTGPTGADIAAGRAEIRAKNAKAEIAFKDKIMQYKGKPVTELTPAEIQQSPIEVAKAAVEAQKLLAAPERVIITEPPPDTSGIVEFKIPEAWKENGYGGKPLQDLTDADIAKAPPKVAVELAKARKATVAELSKGLTDDGVGMTPEEAQVDLAKTAAKDLDIGKAIIDKNRDARAEKLSDYLMEQNVPLSKLNKLFDREAIKKDPFWKTAQKAAGIDGDPVSFETVKKAIDRMMKMKKAKK